ncbi:MAG: hypothetical protein HKM07_03970 [Chlamydiae bacterium]|nr:hypothetical protein [Chlamydiota bacterium]
MAAGLGSPLNSIHASGSNHSEDWLGFLNRRLAGGVPDQVESEGLKNPVSVDKALERLDYIFFYKAVRGEECHKTRLEYLRSRYFSLHVVVIGELLLEEFASDPTAKTLNTVAIPLFECLSFRFNQDGSCIIGLKRVVNSMLRAFKDTYLAQLKQLVLIKTGCSYESLVNNFTISIREATIKEKKIAMAHLTLKASPPPPLWLNCSSHVYTSQILFKESLAFSPEEKWAMLRERYANLIIKFLS